jgi:DNA polymerase/3'-5' exonuclease PolX
MSIIQLTQTIQILPRLSVRERKLAQQPMLPGLEPAEPTATVRTNRQIAEVLASVADLLELQHGNPYRIQAYRNAARGILELREPVVEILERGEGLPVEGLGRRMRAHIAELIQTGRLTFYNDLALQTLPAGVRALLAVEHIGPRSAAQLYEELGIDSVEKLWQAAEQGRIRHLFGFGPRSEARLKEAAARLLQQRAASTLGGAA